MDPLLDRPPELIQYVNTYFKLWLHEKEGRKGSHLHTFWIVAILPRCLQRYALSHDSQLKMLVIIGTNSENLRHGPEAFDDRADFLERWKKDMQLFVKKRGGGQSKNCVKSDQSRQYYQMTQTYIGFRAQRLR